MGVRLTGISLPWLGVQWEKTDGDRQIARRVITFLEDRRVLFGQRHYEDELHCIRSAIEIRSYLTREIGCTKPGGSLSESLKAMRAACRRFIDAGGPDACYFRGGRSSLEADHFSLALGDLRTLIGVHVALLAKSYTIEVEDYLASILPPEPIDDDDPSWMPGFGD